MSVPERVLGVLRALPGVTEEVLWGNDLVYKVGGKMFAVFGLAPHPESDRPDVGGSFKVSDEDFEDLASRPGLKPAPYLARAKWIAFDGWRVLPIDELEARLRGSYALVRAKLSGRAQAALGGPAGGRPKSPASKVASRPAKRPTRKVSRPANPPAKAAASTTKRKAAERPRRRTKK